MIIAYLIIIMCMVVIIMISSSSISNNVIRDRARHGRDLEGAAEIQMFYMRNLLGWLRPGWLKVPQITATCMKRP